MSGRLAFNSQIEKLDTPILEEGGEGAGTVMAKKRARRASGEKSDDNRFSAGNGLPRVIALLYGFISPAMIRARKLHEFLCGVIKPLPPSLENPSLESMSVDESMAYQGYHRLKDLMDEMPLQLHLQLIGMYDNLDIKSYLSQENCLMSQLPYEVYMKLTTRRNAINVLHRNIDILRGLELLNPFRRDT